MSSLLAQEHEAAFPAGWEGAWKGDLQIFSKGKITMEIPMELQIAPTDSAGIFQWTIIYYGEKTDRRAYELVPVDASIGHYVIDEKNSIFLDAFFNGSTLSSRFSVGDGLLLITYTLRGENIEMNIFFGGQEKKQKTGEEVENVGDIYSYPVGSLHRAVLRKAS
ncbi:MAG: hypothetical protein AAFR61_05070 [Bacteroidota bacterium]